MFKEMETKYRKLCCKFKEPPKLKASPQIKLNSGTQKAAFELAVPHWSLGKLPRLSFECGVRPVPTPALQECVINYKAGKIKGALFLKALLNLAKLSRRARNFGWFDEYQALKVFKAYYKNLPPQKPCTLSPPYFILHQKRKLLIVPSVLLFLLTASYPQWFQVKVLSLYTSKF